MRKKNNSRRIKSGLLIILLLLSLSGVMGGLWLKHHTYQPTAAARQALQSATVKRDQIIFPAHEQRQLTVIFYPGALVEPASYAPWAHQVAQAGYTVKIARFPLNLAILAPKQARALVPAHQAYVIGGHSLGGVMAARWAHQHHPAALKGVFFFASYPDQKGRLDHTSLPVLSLTGSRDGVLNWPRFRTAQKYLPRETTKQTITGGNHAGFGAYGPQKGDRAATISNHAQQTAIAQALLKWLATLH